MTFTRLSLLILLNYSVFGELLKLTTVDTTVGQIHGKVGEDFSFFLGIPYGVVDEKNPFGPATPHPYFRTPKEAFNDSAICPQIINGVAKGTIHCLNLNVYTPNNITQGQRLPVMVFIHGGAFVEGNGRLSTYSPKFLVRHNVIVVTANYRLGPYGFLCFNNSEYSNQGLKDQNLALRWVKDNIKSFGGDDENVSLIGHSAGSVAVDLHLLYNNNELFNKVILQSGLAVTPFCDEASNSEFVNTAAKKFGLNTRDMDVNDFIKKISSISTDEAIEIAKYNVFGPCIDQILVTKTPKTKNLQNMKIMIGGMVKEMLFAYPKTDSQPDRNFNFVAELRKGFYKIADHAVDFVRSFYFVDEKDNIVDFVSDFALNYPMERSVRYYLENNSTVYRYLFSYDGPRNYMKICKNISAAGATHADELGYLFDMDMFGNITENDQVIIDRMSELWTNFAKYGDPTPYPTHLLPVKWKPLTTETKPYLQIDTDVGLFNGPFQQRMAFWNLYYNRFGMYSRGIHLGENWLQFTENKCMP